MYFCENVVILAIHKNRMMKTSASFRLYSLGPDNALIGPGPERGQRRMLKLNASAAFLWKAVEGREFDEGELARLLESEYGIDPGSARHDAGQICDAWRNAGLIE